MPDLFSGSLDSGDIQEKSGKPRRKKKSEAPSPAKGQSRFGGRAFVSDKPEPEDNPADATPEREPENEKSREGAQVVSSAFLGKIPSQPPIDNDSGRLARAIDIFKLLDMIETE